MGMAVLAYLRCSTAEQDTGSQRTALLAAGVALESMHEEQPISGSTPAFSRPVLGKLLASLKAGDVLTVYKLDRIARSTQELLKVVEHLRERRVDLRTVDGAVDTTSPQGMLLLTVLGAVGAFERDLIRERTRAGLEHARASGKALGRPKLVTSLQERKVLALYRSGSSVPECAELVGVSLSTAYRVLRAAEARQSASSG